MTYLIIYILIGWFSTIWMEISFRINYKLQFGIEYKNTVFYNIVTFFISTFLGIFCIPLHLLFLKNNKLFKLRNLFIDYKNSL